MNMIKFIREELDNRFSGYLISGYPDAVPDRIKDQAEYLIWSSLDIGYPVDRTSVQTGY